ncbi:Beta-galactosidase protein [Dioscorea alata]|uniref:Beta-galactosidase protein n=1 Tax=Dioscorea alata TaxID=55571 RepID=A0ACB7UAP1_DIOAL|nr:Beta-galactosidase protein [Dioscorea alata]
MQPSINNWHNKTYQILKAHLLCPAGQKMSQIKFASFGTPQGVCGSYSEGACHAHKSYDAFEKEGLLQNCIGQQYCAVAVVPQIFGRDPCPGTIKKLSVEAM